MARKKPSLGPEKDLLRIACFVLFQAVLLRGQPRAQRGRASQSLRASLLPSPDEAAAEPILGLAREILLELPEAPATERMLQILASAAQNASQSELPCDFVGRIYHELLLAAEGRHYATYYTSAPAAGLLAGLVLHTPHPVRDFPRALHDFRIIDPACGSGTLLSAAYRAVREHCGAAGIDPRELHRTLLEDVIHGWDVLDFATHLTRATLASHARDGVSEKTNIATWPLASADDRVRLGSLDALSDPRWRERFDVVLMNPPFSRSAKPNVKFGFGKAAEQQRMNTALRDLAKTHALGKASVAGLTPFFMRLGLDLAKDGGRVGMVVPRSTLSGVGSREIRRKFEAETKLGFIVSNFDPGSSTEGIDGWSWSENTQLGEVLITAERGRTLDNDHCCTFLNVLRRPRDERDALTLTRATVDAMTRLKGSLLDDAYEEIADLGQTIANLYRVPQRSLGGNWLKACTFADPRLNRLCLRVLEQPAMAPLKTFAVCVEGEPALGRDIAAIKPKFRATDSPTGVRIVRGHRASMNTLALASAHVEHAAPKDAAAVRLFDGFAANLLIAERPHLLTESLLAMRASERVVATAFWEVQTKPGCEDWFLLWLNSSYGVMTFLAHATSSMADIFKMKKDQLAHLPVPTPSADAGSLVATLKTKVFAPYAAEFRLAANGRGTRILLDRVLANALALPAVTDDLYLALSREPCVCRRALTSAGSSADAPVPHPLHKA